MNARQPDRMTVLVLLVAAKSAISVARSVTLLEIALRAAASAVTRMVDSVVALADRHATPAAVTAIWHGIVHRARSAITVCCPFDLLYIYRLLTFS